MYFFFLPFFSFLLGIQVKALAAVPGNGLVSTSRDLTVKLWQRTDSRHFLCRATFSAHQRYVNSAAFLPPSTEFPHGLVISGGQDNMINAFSPTSTSQPVLTLLGHGNNVCSLALDVQRQVLISGSWDTTARLWDLRSGQCIATLQGHTMAVWAVAAIEGDDNSWLTGSADKTIKRWVGDKCIQTYTGHSDCVRSITIIPGIGFASASNDGTLRVWSLDGECLQELLGHTAYVYSIDYNASTGELVSAGEDRTVRVWLDGQCTQTITLPATSIWAVAVLSSGDLAVGSNDGIIRVFTRTPEFVADEGELSVFDESVRTHSIPSETVDPKHISSAESLSQPGKKDGDVKMVQNGSVIEAYQWSAAQASWVKVGEVTNVRKDAKKIFEGVEYDYVFDVDIGDEQPMRKLPYNISENPYMAAQRFIEREEISQNYLDDIAKFIMKNTESVTLAQPQTLSDPYTGSSRYTGGAPTSGSATGTPAASSFNPFSFSGAYTTSAVQTGMETSNRPAAASSPSSSSSSSSSVQTQYVALDKGNLAAIHQKIIQLNSELAKDQSTAKFAFTEAEQQSLGLLVETVGNTSRYHATLLFEKQLELLGKGMGWPADKRFPVFDLVRLAIMHPSFVDTFSKSSNPNKLIEVLLQHGQLSEMDSHSGNEIVQMFALRSLVNMFGHPIGRDMIAKQLDSILTALEAFPTSSTNKNLHQALSTFYINLSVLCNEKADVGKRRDLLAVLILQELSNEGIDDDAAARLLLSLATLAHNQPQIATITKQQGLSTYAAVLASRTDARVQQLLKQISSLY